MSEGYPSVSGPKWQWTADLALIGKRIMTLNTDMEVFFDLQSLEAYLIYDFHQGQGCNSIDILGTFPNLS